MANARHVTLLLRNGFVCVCVRTAGYSVHKACERGVAWQTNMRRRRVKNRRNRINIWLAMGRLTNAPQSQCIYFCFVYNSIVQILIETRATRVRVNELLARNNVDNWRGHYYYVECVFAAQPTVNKYPTKCEICVRTTLFAS